jgi:hypothetical protein
LSPTTVKAVLVSVGDGEADVAVAEADDVAPIRAGDAVVAVADAGDVVLIGAGPVGVGVAEHPADSAATVHRAAMAAAGRATLVI